MDNQYVKFFVGFLPMVSEDFLLNCIWTEEAMQAAPIFLIAQYYTWMQETPMKFWGKKIKVDLGLVSEQKFLEAEYNKI